MGHFSGLIGATHTAGFKLFAKGQKPTPGLENLSEHGEHSPLDKEIDAAIKAGKAGTLIETKEGIKGPIHEPVTTIFTTTQKFPMVTMVAMIAPSPDWFAGAADVKLYSNGKWVPTITVDAYAWDSGGDDEETFLADDKDTNPKKATKMADTKHFMENGKRVPVGVFVFTKLPSEEQVNELKKLETPS
ncbi:spondin domain-containing protein [Legionella gresilensis]|uniref:spondin domain-containing protein n=1 Tax=Legionella gresilensis TaxID=91823 RepID=UPI001041A7E3|nr:spondin domain-containing protein [Legionella gresilensis]